MPGCHNNVTILSIYIYEYIYECTYVCAEDNKLVDEVES
jgi:hypothetical protein